MPRIKPYAGTSQTRLSELIRNAQQPPLPTAVQYTFSNLRTGTASVDGATDVTVVASVGPRTDPAIDINYQRLSIDVLSLLPPGFIEEVPVQELPFSIHDILPEINAALGIDLLPEEVVDEVFTEALETYPLTINEPASYAWYSSVYYFKMGQGDINLSDVITNTIMDGLEYAQPETP